MDAESFEWVLKLVTLYYAVRDASYRAWDTTLALWNACAGVWSDKQYVIFEGVPTCAYSLRNVSVWATGSATPTWIVNHTRKELCKWDWVGLAETDTKSHSLPLLSMEVLNGSRVHYDLTDYISELRVRRPVESRDTSVPTIPELIAAWSAASQIVLHPSRFTIRVITDMGDTECYTLRGERIADTYESLPESDSESESKKDE
jgi:hypothetical protein